MIRLDRFRLRGLNTSNGCQDHTVLPYAISAVRLARYEPLTNIALRSHSRARRCRVHRIPRPTSVTIAIRPSCGHGIARVVRLIWVSEKAKYFLQQGWTQFCKRYPTGKSVMHSPPPHARRSHRITHSACVWHAGKCNFSRRIWLTQIKTNLLGPRQCLSLGDGSSRARAG